MEQAKDQNQVNAKLGESRKPRGNSPQSNVTEKVEISAQHARRSRVLHKLAIPILLAIGFILMVSIGHDLFVKNEYLKNIEQLGQQIDTFKSVNKQLPSHADFLLFEIRSRNLSIDEVHYDKSLILNGSPKHTILAHTPMPNLRLLGSGHAVLYLDGCVDWVGPEQLRQLINERKKQYNANVLRSKP